MEQSTLDFRDSLCFPVKKSAAVPLNILQQKSLNLAVILV